MCLKVRSFLVSILSDCFDRSRKHKMILSPADSVTAPKCLIMSCLQWRQHCDVPPWRPAGWDGAASDRIARVPKQHHYLIIGYPFLVRKLRMLSLHTSVAVGTCRVLKSSLEPKKKQRFVLFLAGSAETAPRALGSALRWSRGLAGCCFQF